MVQELKTTNNANRGSKSIDLSALGEVGNAKIGGEIKEKPKIMSPIEATVKDFEIKMRDEYEHNKDDPTKMYHPAYITITTEFINPETNELETSKDSFGGFRFYVKLDGTLTPIKNELGDDVIERIWVGDRSQSGALLKLVQEYDKSVLTYSDFFNFFKDGLRVEIQSIFSSFGGKQTHKQGIVRIL